MRADHPHTDPGDGRTECLTCGKWVSPPIHSCKRVPVTEAARRRAAPEAEAPEHTEQPMPVPSNRPSIQSLVRHDLEQREQVGIERYGTALQAHNGRDALRDAYEEALDLACYLRQAIEERDRG